MVQHWNKKETSLSFYSKRVQRVHITFAFTVHAKEVPPSSLKTSPHRQSALQSEEGLQGEKGEIKYVFIYCILILQYHIFDQMFTVEKEHNLQFFFC